MGAMQDWAMSIAQSCISQNILTVEGAITVHVNLRGSPVSVEAGKRGVIAYAMQPRILPHDSSISSLPEERRSTFWGLTK